MNSKHAWIWILAVAVLATLGAYALVRRHTSSDIPVASASYVCDAGKVIAAAYYNASSTPASSAGEPPVPHGRVVVALSDGRTMTLSETISADGARYANEGETIIFWNKGRGVTFAENGEQTYAGCIEVATNSGNLPGVYANGVRGFSLRYPSGYTVDESYQYQQLGLGKEIEGVKFTIDPSEATGTNLSDDSYLSIEKVSAQTCSAALFLGAGAKVQTITEGDTTYSVASSTDAAAGNRYEETVYAVVGTVPCTAARYAIHYSLFENYPAGSVKQFDKQALLDQFDAVRRTLIVAP